MPPLPGPGDRIIGDGACRTKSLTLAGADLGISKGFELPYNHRLRFRWEIFNLTNTVRFNTNSVTMTPDVTSTFGRYDSVLGTCDGRAGRCMQASLKYEF